MAEEDVSLEILIKTAAETYGADEAQKALDKFKEQAGGAGENVEKMNKGGREMRHLMRELNHVIPGLGTAMKAAFNPEAVGLIATLIAVQQLVKLLESAKKKAEELRKQQAESVTSMWEQQSKMMAEARQAWSDMSYQLTEAAKANDKLRASQELELAVLEAQAEAAKKAADGDKAFQEQIAITTEKLKERLLVAKASAEAQAGEAAQRRFEAAGAARAEFAKGGAPDAALAQAFLEASKSKVVAAQVELDKAKAKTIGPLGFGEFPEARRQLEADRLKRIDELTKLLEEAKVEQETANAAVRSFAEQTKYLEEEEKKAFTEVQKHVQAVKDTTAALDKQKAVTEAVSAGTRVGERTAAGLGFGAGNRIGANLQRLIEEQEGFVSGRSTPSVETNKLMMALINEMRQAGASQEQVRAVLDEMTNLHISHEQKLKDIWNVIKALQQRVRGVANP